VKGEQGNAGADQRERAVYLERGGTARSDSISIHGENVFQKAKVGLLVINHENACLFGTHL